ncbi:DUF1835 domain-containing protein [Lysinibacillus agricola]|uniref:DUF1835 domain-containing protein n=1 Tax=Lysinibacillus agricola TaxID=2590012 RepID=A0ABX7AW62_9BACI|nr:MULTISPECIES: DUF1835 domain-containing protein [Lysinibacillus]KOS63462.1 hypothetical protein AN161_07330 [Lysinibacillus sp. FJAT-14222]QQP14198.1 DUF1835 domain-containing protein [Lysinibacillus agricola]
MEWKVNYPFIYFLLELNTVFVYRIKTHNYLNASDLIDSSEWEAYELQHLSQFETFNHEESEAIEGWGFSLEYDKLCDIVEIVNDCIQKHRSVDQRLTTQAVHIVSTESAAGSVRVALAPPKHVIGFPDCFSIGPLWKLEEKRGQDFRNDWLFENINDGEEDVYQNKFTNTLREIEDIPNHVPIYIWYGNNADEQCGLRYFLYLLRDKSNEIFLINTTEHSKTNCATSQLNSQQLAQLFVNIKERKQLTTQDRLILQNEWEIVSQNNDVLRLWINNEIKGVPENYFDPLIIETIEKLHNEQVTKDFIKTGTVIAELLPLIDELPSVFFLECRIRFLVYSGVLALKGIPKSMRHYSVKLRE